MEQDTAASLESSTRTNRDDIVTLTAVAIITVFSLLFPYAVLSSEWSAVTFGSSPSSALSGTTVYLLSPLAGDPSYYDYSAVASAARTYGYVFILLTQTMVILHMFVGSGRIRSPLGLLLSLILSTIWICLCEVIYGFALPHPLAGASIMIRTAHIVQYPFVPLVSSALMLLYRNER